MAVLKDHVAAPILGTEWMTALAVFGAISCIALGVFKRFRASMSLGISGVQQSTNDPHPAVYRQFREEEFTPSYRIIDEESSEVTTLRYPSQTHNGSIVNQTLPNPIKINTLNSQQITREKPMNGHIGSQNNLSVSNEPSTSQNKTSNRDKTNSKLEDKEKKKHKNKTSEKQKDKTKVKNTNEKNTENKSEEEKKDKSKTKDKKVKKEKGEKEKKDKNKSKQKETSKAVASVTIDEDAVASARGGQSSASLNTTPKPPPYVKDDIFNKSSDKIGIRNKLTNPIAAQATLSTNIQAEPQGFTSSWDQVALHRQNIQRDNTNIRPQPTNIRGMMNQNRAEGREINSLFIPSANSPRNKNSARRFSPPSDYNSESDTEA